MLSWKWWPFLGCSTQHTVYPFTACIWCWPLPLWSKAWWVHVSICFSRQKSCLLICGSSGGKSHGIVITTAGFRFTFIAVGGLVMRLTCRSMNDSRGHAWLCFAHLYWLFVSGHSVGWLEMSCKTNQDINKDIETYWNYCVVCLTVAIKKWFSALSGYKMCSELHLRLKYRQRQYALNNTRIKHSQCWCERK